MTSIERVQGGSAAPQTSARPAPQGGAAFASALEAGAGRAPESPTGVAGASALASMLTLQEFGGGQVREREARRRGQGLLAALAALQRDLLSGGDGSEALQRLADLTATAADPDDRQLGAILNAITLRARVELARRGM